MDLVQPVAVEEVEALAAVAVPEPAAPEPVAPVPEPAVPVPEPRLKRRKVTVDSFVREWFLEFAVLQKAQKGWGMTRPLAAAKRLAPEVFKDISRNAPYRWASSKEAAHSTGRPCMLSGAQLTVLSEQVAAVADRLPVSVVTMRAVITEQLLAWEVPWKPSRSWVAEFLHDLGLSYKKSGGTKQGQLPAEVN